MSAEWVEGRFEGVYSGELSRAPRRSRGRRARTATPRRFGMHIDSGRLAPMAGSAFRATDEGRLIRQARLDGVRLVDEEGNDDEVERTLFDVEIRDWHLAYPAEAEGRAYGTIFGRLRARTRPGPDSAPGRSVSSPDAKLGSSSDRVAAVDEDRSHRAGSPSETLARLGRTTLALILFVIAMAIGALCGPRIAMLWLAPVLLAIAVRRFLSRWGRVRAPAGSLPALVGLPVGGLWLSWERAAEAGCTFTLAPAEAVLFALPMILSIVLGWRTCSWASGGVWTVSVCLACSLGGFGVDSACTLGGRAPAPQEAKLGDESTTGLVGPTSKTSARSRVRPDGGWPVMPPMPGGGAESSAGKTMLGLADSRGQSGEIGASEQGEAPSASAASSTSDGRSTHLEGLGSDSMPGPVGALEPPGSPSDSNEQAAAPPAEPDARGRAASTAGGEGGWLSPEHRRTRRELTLISLEQANRTPDLLFSSRGTRRVYVPTDSIFEGTGAALASGAQLVLGRLAALVQARGEQAVVIELHTDSSGSPASQRARATARAAVLRGWLLDRGHLPPGAFSIVPVGGARPLLPPDGDYAAQRPNRRLEIGVGE